MYLLIERRRKILIHIRLCLLKPHLGHFVGLSILHSAYISTQFCPRQKQFIDNKEKQKQYGNNNKEKETSEQQTATSNQMRSANLYISNIALQIYNILLIYTGD